MKATTEFVRRSEFDLSINSNSSIQNSKSRIGAIRNQVYRLLLNAFVGRSEPQIRQSVDRTGNALWHVYEPANGHSACFSSEREVREWLDQRYYL